MFGYPLPRWLIILPVAGFALAAAAGFALTQKTATITEGRRTISLQTSAATVADAVRAAGLTVYPEDVLQPAGETPLASGAAITITRALPVRVTDDGVTYLVRTHQKKIAAILAEAGRTVAPADIVYADGQPVPGDLLGAVGPVPHSILIQRAVPVTILDGAGSATITTAASTVGRALAGAGVVTYLADGVTPPLETPVTAGMTVRIDRSAPAAVEVDGRTILTRTHRRTVAEVLAEAGVALLGLDFTVPSLSEPPPADGPIRVVRVVERIVTEQKPLPYGVQYQALSDLEIDSTRLVQAGAQGIRAARIRVRYENGVEVSRGAEDEWTLVAPKPRIVGYGTQIVLRLLDTPGGPVEYWRALRMYATSYSASRAGTPRTAPWYGRTRSGKVLTVGMVAVDLNVMPLGTRLYIPGYGLATAEDTGGGVKGAKIDLGYDDWNYVSWHSYVTVYFLAPVPPAEQIRWVLP